MGFPSKSTSESFGRGTHGLLDRQIVWFGLGHLDEGIHSSAAAVFSPRFSESRGVVPLRVNGQRELSAERAAEEVFGRERFSFPMNLAFLFPAIAEALLGL
jgi:hypothetical protein